MSISTFSISPTHINSKTQTPPLPVLMATQHPPLTVLLAAQTPPLNSSKQTYPTKLVLNKTFSDDSKRITIIICHTCSKNNFCITVCTTTGSHDFIYITTQPSNKQPVCFYLIDFVPIFGSTATTNMKNSMSRYVNQCTITHSIQIKFTIRENPSKVTDKDEYEMLFVTITPTKFEILL